MLDLGCGCGDLIHAAQGLSRHVHGVGIDQDPTQIETAKRNGKGEFHQGQLLASQRILPDKFDLVVSFEFFEHLTHEEHGKALELYKAYAHPGALGVVMVPNTAHPLMGGWLAWSDYTHRSCFTPDSLAQMLRQHGIQEFQISPWHTAGRPVLLQLRRALAPSVQFVFRAVCALQNTAPRTTDPSIRGGSLPLSSHLIAVFRIPGMKPKTLLFWDERLTSGDNPARHSCRWLWN